MYRWEISKEFEACYGHRVWSQNLDKDFSIDGMCTCRRIHGHNTKILIYLSSNTLDQQGMVTDFKNLSWFKKWLDDVIDHKFIMDINDPLFDFMIRDPIEKSIQGNFGSLELIKHKEEYYTINERSYSDLVNPLQELYEGFVFVNFVPTSENLSKWIFKIVQDKMKGLGVRVSKVEFYETPKSKSSYINMEE